MRRRVTWLVAAITSRSDRRLPRPAGVPAAHPRRGPRRRGRHRSQSQTLLAVAGGAFATQEPPACRRPWTRPDGRPAASGHVRSTCSGRPPPCSASWSARTSRIRASTQARRRTESFTRRGEPTVVYATAMLSRGDERLVLVARTEIGDDLLHQGVRPGDRHRRGARPARAPGGDLRRRPAGAPDHRAAARSSPPSPTACARARSTPGCPRRARRRSSPSRSR